MDNDINFIINGEIYLKKGSESADLSELIKKTDDIIFCLDYVKPIEKDKEKIDDFLTKFKLLKTYEESIDEKQSFSGAGSFWKAFTTDGRSIELRQCDIVQNDARIYSSIEELNSDFIKLSDFLNKATFVGRKFKRTTPLKAKNGKSDRSFMDVTYNEYIVLYATQDLFLVKETDELDGDKYRLIYSRYTLDGNYVFYGEVYSEYKDKQKVYSEILEQLKTYNKGKAK